MKTIKFSTRINMLVTPKVLVSLLLAGFLGLMISCTSSEKRFALPEGNVDQGKIVFTELSCNQCHSVADIKWLGNLSPDSIHVRLGGEVSKVKSYEELVTSVINPSHKIERRFMKEPFSTDGQSKMMNYNDYMTITDLCNLVTFLESEYKIVTARDRDYFPTW